jgi:hypothetical protein
LSNNTIASLLTGTPEKNPTSGTRLIPLNVFHHEGTEQVAFSRETVEELLAGEGFFWLDLDPVG